MNAARALRSCLEGVSLWSGSQGLQATPPPQWESKLQPAWCCTMQPLNNAHAQNPAFCPLCPLLGGLSSFGVSFIRGFTAQHDWSLSHYEYFNATECWCTFENSLPPMMLTPITNLFTINFLVPQNIHFESVFTELANTMLLDLLRVWQIRFWGILIQTNINAQL